jgi:hypothetical protein
MPPTIGFLLPSVTVADVIAWWPCDAYTERRITDLFAGRERMTGEAILDLTIPVEDRFWAVLHAPLLTEAQQRLFAADVAEHVLHLYERDYPQDGRPRAAIVAARRFARGEIGAAARDAAWAAAGDAARTAAGDAAWTAAGDAAWAAARDAARTAAGDAARAAAGAAAWAAAWAAARDAARDAARTAAWDAAWDAERDWQIDRCRAYLCGLERGT